MISSSGRDGRRPPLSPAAVALTWLRTGAKRSEKLRPNVRRGIVAVIILFAAALSHIAAVSKAWKWIEQRSQEVSDLPFLGHSAEAGSSQGTAATKIRRRDDDANYPFTFSACLLIKDDNVILPEWLAYHYTVMPLRRVIVAVDPLSITDPGPIFDLYRDLGMNITEWRTDDYIYTGRWSHDRPGYLRSNSTDFEKGKFYVWRQQCFYTACLKQLKREGRSWTTLIDTDEYFTFNTYHENEGNPDCCNGPERYPKEESKMFQPWCLAEGRPLCVEQFLEQVRSESHPRSQLLRFIGNATIADFIASGIDPMYEKDQRPCITYPRIMFGAKESTHGDIYDRVPNDFNASFFHTLRFRKHGPKQFATNGKPLFDVSRYNGVRVNNPHRPLRKQCRWVPGEHYSATAFRIHHYTGSLESFLRVGFDARGEGTFRDRNNYTVKGEDDTMRWWLSSFVDLVGKDEALQLTQLARLRAQLEVNEWREKNLPNSIAST